MKNNSENVIEYEGNSKVSFPILFPLKGFLHYVGKHAFS
jgi:hypothetical protein